MRADHLDFEPRAAAAGKYLLQLATYMSGAPAAQLANALYDLLVMHGAGTVPCRQCGGKQPCPTGMAICTQVESMIVERMPT